MPNRDGFIIRFPDKDLAVVAWIHVGPVKTPARWLLRGAYLCDASVLFRHSSQHNRTTETGRSAPKKPFHKARITPFLKRLPSDAGIGDL